MMATQLLFKLGAAKQERIASQRPSRLLLALESRAALEMASLSLAIPLLLRHIPRGDGHPVLVLPGLMAGDASTAPLRAFLNIMGYAAEGWGMGINRGPRDGVFEALQDKLTVLHDRNQRKVSIIGWSLGGVYARELARTAPDRVRQILTLGTPLHGDPDSTTNASRIYHLVSGKTRAEDPLRNIGPAPVPTTSVYSRTDGVVAWGASVERSGSQVQNVEVRHASHSGLGVNPLVWLVVGDRLSQSQSAWHQFVAPVWVRWMFPATTDHNEVAL